MLLKGPETKLNSYGLLIGKITASRPKRPASPHWLLFVQPDRKSVV